MCAKRGSPGAGSLLAVDEVVDVGESEPEPACFAEANCLEGAVGDEFADTCW